MSKSNVLIGVLAGVAIGAVLGILLAPAKGSKTRRKLSQKANATKDELKLKFDELLDGIASQFEETIADAGVKVHQASKKVEEIKKEVKTHLS
ncbi:MAG: YtxH domain-containing protein [Saprospiraceae bacterium]|nr:YtxH domain-containing protein [Saprospiraceae bacterium]MBK7812740.1 YtxH domain-containing protein [Saprospiraceae bacterium]MBK9630931.1 YtxH domain-containing protein [Saprospiraceae bacterium]